jgi:hypothetical protein
VTAEMRLLAQRAHETAQLSAAQAEAGRRETELRALCGFQSDRDRWGSADGSGVQTSGAARGLCAGAAA